MKLYLTPPNQGYSPSTARVLSKGSMPLQSVRSLAASRRQVSATSTNVGNLIHCEAVAKTFDLDLEHSASGSIERLYKIESKRKTSVFHSKLENFDGVVFSVANMISLPLAGREEQYDERFNFLAEMIDAINVPVFILGMGMQNPIPDASVLPASIRNYFDVLNRKAAIWGVRGVETESFLHSLGYDTAEALGCPSLYVYPESILGIEPIKSFKGLKGMTAGYLDRRHLLGSNPKRLEALTALSNSFDLSYVFQNDLYTLQELENVEGIFEDATNTCNKELLEEYFRSFGYEFDFESYHFFRDPRAWREFANARDFYFGDRFHGGVAAMQVRRPSLFIWNDLRVRELTGHFNIPSISLDTLLEIDPSEAMADATSAKRLSEMTDVYEERAQHYFNRMNEHGFSPNHERYTKKKPAAMSDLAGFEAEVEAVFSDMNVPNELAAAWRIQKTTSHEGTVAERVFGVASRLCAHSSVLDLANVYKKHHGTLRNWSEDSAFAIARVLRRDRNYEAVVSILSTIYDPDNPGKTRPIIKKLYDEADKLSEPID